MRTEFLGNLIFIFVFVSTMVLPQQQTRHFRGRVGKAMNYQLVKKESLNENVVDVLYLPDNERGLQTPDLLLLGKRRPNNSLAIDKMMTYSDKAVIKDSLMDPIKVFFSENLQYFGVNRMIKRPTVMDMNGKTAFQLFERSGKLLFEKETEQMYDLPFKEYLISNTGLVFEIDHINLSITLYDKSGKLIVQKDFSTSKVFDLSKGIRSTMSNHAQRLALVTNDFKHDGTEIIQLFVIDFNLKIIYQRSLDSEHTGYVNISNTGNIILWSSLKGPMMQDKETYFYNIPSRKEIVIDQVNTNRSKFYDDQFVIIAGRRRATLYDMNKYQQHFQYKIFGKDILSYDYAPYQKLIFILEGRRGKTKNELNHYWNVSVKVFNLNQVPAYELNLGNIEHKSKGRAFLSCTDDASEFIFRIGDAIYTYQAIQ